MERQHELVDHRLVPRDAVDRDARDGRTALGELLVLAGAADQLPIAVRSPVAAQEEQDHRAIEVVTEAPGFAPLIVEREVDRKLRHEATP
jgi:hypothetical protein